MNRFLTLCVALLAISAFGCEQEQPPPTLTSVWGPGNRADASSDAPSLFDTGTHDGPPSADADGLCGNQFFHVDQVPVNIYFVLDRSGSMSDVMPGQGISKYTAVRKACVSMVQQMGARARVGAAVFPGHPETDSCSAGKQVFPTTRGDAPEVADGGPGPVTIKFAGATNVIPKGGTSVSSTLQVLKPTLEALEGHTVVILATDGGPNCNAGNACGPDGCMWNIEGRSVGGQACTPSFNCCAPGLKDGPGYLGCLDSDATLGILEQLSSADIRTYVIGIPGSQAYGDLLDDMAHKGGTARDSTPEPAYYRVDDIGDLTSVLEKIGHSEAVTCEFDLDQPPPDPNRVNVYVNGHVLPMDPENGWTWSDEDTLVLNGEACARLKSGEIDQVQVVAGCPTKTPK